MVSTSGSGVSPGCGDRIDTSPTRKRLPYLSLNRSPDESEAIALVSVRPVPAFSYVPGQPLEKYIDLGPIDSAKDVDVHGKQGKLLMKSRCCQMSGNMNCSTCHDVHKREPDLAVMSQHCLSCHKVEETATHKAVGAGIAENCIDCHMPKLESKVVDLDVNGKQVRPRFRSHWIKIYSEDERK